MYERIKQDIQQDTYYSQNFANDGERFLAWYLRNIYLRTPVQTRDDITDGQDDKEIDAVAGRKSHYRGNSGQITACASMSWRILSTS